MSYVVHDEFVLIVDSKESVGIVDSGQGRAGLYCGEGKDTSEHGGEYECQSQVVECIPAAGVDWHVHISSLVVEAVFRGKMIILMMNPRMLTIFR